MKKKNTDEYKTKKNDLKKKKNRWIKKNTAIKNKKNMLNLLLVFINFPIKIPNWATFKLKVKTELKHNLIKLIRI